jgi:hypothetical protein
MDSLASLDRFPNFAAPARAALISINVPDEQRA